jgi:hypothetical protein
MEIIMSKRSKRILILLTLIILSSVIIVETVNADIAPPVVPGFGGLKPFEYQDTQVQMVYERVEMELFTVYEEGFEDENPYYLVDVVAWFVMRNTGRETEQMQALFPIDNMNNCLEFDQVSSPPSYNHYEILPESFTFIINGTDVPFIEIETDHPYGDLCRVGGWSVNWAAFDVTFPVEQDVLIRVEYQMKSYGYDNIHNIQYVLETGAGWKGPIETAYIIMKFPGLVSDDLIIGETTDGFQTLHNEIFWSFDNIEPTRHDNILISFVAPDVWQRINKLKENLSSDPNDVVSWIELANTYSYIGSWRYDQPRSQYHIDKAYDTFYLGVNNNPNNADIIAAYANFLIEQYGFHEPPTDKELNAVISLVEKSLLIDPSNDMAHYVKDYLESVVEGLTIQVPNTHTPTATPTSTLTPTSKIQDTIAPTVPKSVTETVFKTSTVTFSVTPSPAVTDAQQPVKDLSIESVEDSTEGSNTQPYIFIAIVVAVICIGFFYWRIFIYSKPSDE